MSGRSSYTAIANEFKSRRICASLPWLVTEPLLDRRPANLDAALYHLNRKIDHVLFIVVPSKADNTSHKLLQV